MVTAIRCLWFRNGKIGDKVPEEKLAEIQDAVVSGLKAKKA